MTKIIYQRTSVRTAARTGRSGDVMTGRRCVRRVCRAVRVVVFFSFFFLCETRSFVACFRTASGARIQRRTRGPVTYSHAEHRGEGTPPSGRRRVFVQLPVDVSSSPPSEYHMSAPWNYSFGFSTRRLDGDRGFSPRSTPSRV